MNLRRAAKAVWRAMPIGRPPALYRGRPCQGRVWRQRYPNVAKQEIRAFLLTFADSFAYRKHEKLKFSPDDALLAIYRAHYPARWMPDALEMETLAARLQKRYGLSLTRIWRDTLTLGEVFEATRHQ